MRRSDVTFANVAGRFARNNTKRAYLHRTDDYKIVETRPDGAILAKDCVLWEPKSHVGFMWLHGEERLPPDFTATRQSFCDGYIPIHTIAYDAGFLRFAQTSFTTRVKGIPCTAIRLTVRNAHLSQPQCFVLTASVIHCAFTELYEHGNEDYLPFETLIARWHQGETAHALSGNAVVHQGNVAAYFDTECPASLDARGLLRFTGELAVGAEATVTAFMPYEWAPYDEANRDTAGERLRNAVTDTAHFANADFDALLQAAKADWEELFAKATQVCVPEPSINRIYKTLVVNSLQFIAHPPGRDYPVCGQGGYNNFSVIYAWEANRLLTTLESLGYSSTVEGIIDYYLSIQGKAGPEGDILSTKGAFRPHIFWMCETGAVMRLMAWHYFQTGDAAWLRRVSGNLLEACEWVRRERNATKTFDAQGNPVAHYGLLPAGRVHDWPDKGHFYYSDVHTYEGYRLGARALAEIGIDGAERYVDDAKDYLACIRDAYAKTVYPHPRDPALNYHDNQVYGKPGHVMTSYGGDGPVCMVETGVIPPDDPRVDEFLASLKALDMADGYFYQRMPEMEDAWFQNKFVTLGGKDYRLYYVVSADSVWFATLLKRGDTAHALGILYNTLAYATTRDLCLAGERFSPDLRLFIPWQPNASANGCILRMIHQTLFYEQDDALHLLAGAHPDWLAPGQRITVTEGRTLSYAFSFALDCADDGTAHFRLAFLGDRRPERAILHLHGLALHGVHATDVAFETTGNTVTFTNPRDSLHIHL